VVINTGLSRAKFFHTNFYIFAYSSLAIVSLFILIAVTFVLESIKNEMVELAPGGIVSVITKPYVGSSIPTRPG